ncbi:MAG TPA: M28 family peptidase [Bdellovibrionota bacterium]|nr:M28 family peptidase [Bdellovibrionota bacterium]
MKNLLLFSTILGFSTTFAFAVQTYRPSNDAKKAAQTIQADTILGPTRFLSSDLLEGRAPASNGDHLAQQYIASQFEAEGLKPAGPNGSWFQEFDLVGVTSGAPKIIHFQNKSKTLSLKYSTDYMGVSGIQSETASVKSAELVFVGYGIVAPEYGWDDFKDVDVRGKILLMMNNDPSSDDKLFAGKTRLYYGRWTYKYEIAAAKGAAGAIIIHTHESAGYPWQVVQTSWAGEQFELPHEGGPTTVFNAWATEDSVKKLVALSGKNLDELRAAAEKKDFRPVPLGTTFSVQMKNVLHKTKTANVLGILTGSDPELSKEAVVYMAHHDHLGKKAGAKPGEDTIYNGALDNASGVGALLALVRAYNSLSERPRRSILFAAVGAEEAGTLGSEYLAHRPVIEPGRMAAVINMDGISIWGAASDLTMVGKGKSTLDTEVESIAKMQGRIVKPDQFPDRGYYYRSDHFSLAKIGVPAAYFDAGIDILGKPKGWGKEQIEKWEDTHYHQPSDEVRPDWDLSGAVQDIQLNFYLGYEVAQAKEMPRWNPNDEFEAVRLEALKRIATQKGTTVHK